MQGPPPGRSRQVHPLPSRRARRVDVATAVAPRAARRRRPRRRSRGFTIAAPARSCEVRSLALAAPVLSPGEHPPRRSLPGQGANGRFARDVERAVYGP